MAPTEPWLYPHLWNELEHWLCLVCVLVCCVNNRQQIPLTDLRQIISVLHVSVCVFPTLQVSFFKLSDGKHHGICELSGQDSMTGAQLETQREIEKERETERQRDRGNYGSISWLTTVQPKKMITWNCVLLSHTQIFIGNQFWCHHVRLTLTQPTAEDRTWLC